MRSSCLVGLLVFPALLASCASQPQQSSLAPFSTDGCSLFPDHALVGGAEWLPCCVEHDLAYWRGGTEEERLQADRALEQCVLTKTSDQVLAASMLAGVRVGGSPYLNTPFRWGYGWPYERKYQRLSADELREASRLESEFRADRAR